MSPRDGMPHSCVTQTPPTFTEEFFETFRSLAAWRRDVRRFVCDPIDEADLDAALSVADLSPSVGNAQPWRWVRVDAPERRAAVITSFEAANQDAADSYVDEKRDLYLSLKLAGLRDAPVHLAVFCDEGTKQGAELGRRTMPEMLRYSVVCSIQNFWLAARMRGLGVGWVSILEPETVTEALDVPRDWRLIAYLCVGKPLENHEDPELQRHGWQARQPMTVVKR
ncbi:MAG: 5,6-dimethylbenzimidazole synthase [Pseudomonadota bacterium]